ncbi:MAG TPA: TolC family protein [Puia sp.]|nr:TolC family protein [Puia sp.]
MKFFIYLILLTACIPALAQDRNLDYYLGLARTNSPLLKDYRNQVQLNKVDSEIIIAGYRPQVNGVSNNSYAPSINGFGYDYAITNGGQLSALVQANKTFVSKRNLAAQVQTIHLQNEAVGTTSIIAEKELKKAITAQYISVYGDLAAMNFTREILRLLQNEEIILKNLTQNNIYKQSDYLSFYVTLQQQQLAFRQTEIQFRNDYATLNYLCGIVDTAAVPIPDPDLKLASLPEVYTTSFYRQYLIDSLKIINQRTVLDFSYKPKLNLFADAGYNSSFSYQGYKNFGTSFGLSLVVPIYDGRQRQLKYKKFALDERTRTGYRDFFLRQYDQQIAQLFQQLKSTELLIEEINSQIKYSSTLIEVNGKLLEKGDIRITDFILSINTYLNARHLLNQNYISRLQLINQINYWESI